MEETHYLRAMVTLADIFREISAYLQESDLDLNRAEHSSRLQKRLTQWRADLPDVLSLHHHSLDEPDWAFRQKAILNLRE